MISFALVVPLLVAVVLCAAVACLHHRLPPALTARLLASGLVAVLVAAVPTAWVIALDRAWHLPDVHDVFGWCTAIMHTHHSMPPSSGLVATVVAVVGTVRCVRYVRSFRRICQHQHAHPTVTHDPVPFAVTMPGRGGQVVLSSGMVELLEPDERAVVLAHERAHADCRHDRYLLLACVAERFLPPLRPVASRLRLALERWADELAAEVVGDRRLVARTLRKVALEGAGLTGALSFQSVGVVRRIEALRAPLRLRPRELPLTALLLAATLGAAAAGVQLHHLADVVRSWCAT